MGISDTVKGFLSYYLPIVAYVCILPGLVLARIGWIRASGWWYEHREAKRQGLIKEMLKDEEARRREAKSKVAAKASTVMKKPGHAKKKSKSFIEARSKTEEKRRV